MKRKIYVAMVAVVITANAAGKQLLWGDTHLHTTYSSDAYTNNNLTAKPDVAYRYARGVPVVHPYHKARVQIETPLDFLVVSDHAELLGGMRSIHRDGVDTSGGRDSPVYSQEGIFDDARPHLRRRWADPATRPVIIRAVGPCCSVASGIMAFAPYPRVVSFDVSIFGGR